jgi:hypothetical protein
MSTQSTKGRARIAMGIAGTVAVGAIAFGWSLARARKQVAPALERPALGASDGVVPRATGVISVDGELDEAAWFGALRSQAFRTGEGTAPARPHSEARLMWSDSTLYVALYAADDNIQARIHDPDGPLWLSDAFQLGFRRGEETWRIDVSPQGVLSDAKGPRGGALDHAWSSGARAAFDVDGTINDDRDRDEEWLIEMAIPLASLQLSGRPGERVEIFVKRCDELRSGGRSCGVWGTEEKPVTLVFGGPS